MDTQKLHKNEEEGAVGGAGAGGDGDEETIGQGGEVMSEESKSTTVSDYQEEIMSMVDELRQYTERTLYAKDDRHEKYIFKRLDKIELSTRRLAEEAKRIGQVDKLAEKVVRLDKKMEKFSDLNKKVEEMESSMRNMGKYMETFRISMDGINQNVCRLGETVEKVPWSGVEDVARKLDALRAAEVGDVREEMAKVVEAVKEATGVLSMGSKAERTEVEREETWAEVIRKGKKRKGERGPQVVIEVPKEGERRKREELVEALDVKEGEVRVRSLRRKGKNFVVELHDHGDLNKLKESDKLKEKGFVVNGEPKMRSPRITIFGVDKELQGDDLRKAVMTRNKDLFQGWSEDECQEMFIPKRIRSVNAYGKNWVAQVDPRLYERIMVLGRLYVGVRSCRVEENLDVLQCFKCQALGHVGSACGGQVTCVRCGGGHHASRCSGQEGVKCANCIRMGLKEANHSTRWKGCPVMMQARRRLRGETNYHG